MNFIDRFYNSDTILMEGALGERLKREFNLSFDKTLALAPVLYNKKGNAALQTLWGEYITIAKENKLPFMATTPTRRVNKETVAKSQYDSKFIRNKHVYRWLNGM